MTKYYQLYVQIIERDKRFDGCEDIDYPYGQVATVATLDEAVSIAESITDTHADAQPWNMR